MASDLPQSLRTINNESHTTQLWRMIVKKWAYNRLTYFNYHINKLSFIFAEIIILNHLEL